MALIDWLKANAEKAPKRVDGSHEARKGEGRIKSNVAHGSIILKGGDRLLSLVWSGKKKTRAVPVGFYEVQTTRVVRKGEQATWLVSSTGPRGKRVRVRPQKTLRFDVDPTIHFKAHAKWQRGELRLGFGLSNAAHRGISIYKDWKRIRIGYKVLDAKGRELSRGVMRYG